MNRQTLISAAVAGVLAAVSMLVLPDLDAASWRYAFSPHLLEPSGSYDIGVRRFRVDTGADDPWNPGHARVVMVDVHYPAAGGGNGLRQYTKAQYMTEQAMLAWAPDREKRLGLREDEVNWLFRTHSHEWAPPDSGRYPVVVMSALRGGMRTSFTMLAEDLASHGHVVVTVDHPYDAPVVELWQTRRVIEPDDAARHLPEEQAEAARTTDRAAVAARLTRIDDELTNPTGEDPLFGEALLPGCVLALSDTLQNAATGLTDEPVIQAQLAANFPRIKEALAPDRSPIRAERDFRTRSDRFRAALTAKLAEEPTCPDVG